MGTAELARLTGHSQRQVRHWARARTVAPLAIELRAGRRGYWWQENHPALVGWIRRHTVDPLERGRRGRKPLAAYARLGRLSQEPTGKAVGQRITGLIALAGTLARRSRAVMDSASPNQRAKLRAALASVAAVAGGVPITEK